MKYLNPYEMFETSDDYEVNGKWKSFGGFKVKLARAGGRNTMWKKSFAEFSKDYKGADSGSVSEEIIIDIVMKTFCEAAVKDWEVRNEKGEWRKGIYVKNKKGEVELRPVNFKNILKCLKQLPDLYDKLDDAAKTLSFFQSKKEEDLIKN